MALDEIRKTKIEKVKKLRKAGINPYPAVSNRTHSISEALANFEKFIDSKQEIVLAGRVMAKREMGGVIFFDIYDGSSKESKIQGLLREDNIGKDKFEQFKNFIDIGDFIEIKGPLSKTKTGERTLLSTFYLLLSKAILPLPEKWHGLQDIEERLRKRYLDFIFNPESRDIVEKRAVFWNAVREFHVKNGFLEVETPVLETTVGGADATPFVTHHGALDMDVYLRISSGELWQKRLIVAGFNKTFEIGRIFRNEGISAEHLQDYTQCEAYWAYADYRDMYKFLQECYRYVAEKTFGTLKFKINNFDIDLGADWPFVDYAEEVKKQTGIDIWKAAEKEIKNKLKELKVEYNKVENKARLIDSLWKYC
ncbi:MAG: amino acid--tRNA ligase-related protein, partial [Patescibacteria group bacterium]